MAKVRRYPAPTARRSEILRYAGISAAGLDFGLDGLVDSCLAELSGGLSCAVCFEELEVREGENIVTVGDMEISSESFRKYIRGCDRAVVFAATVGIFPDRLIRRYSRVSPSRALVLDASGSELVERLCDGFCREIKDEAAKRGYGTQPRFSPGYGDLPLELQRDIFELLKCDRSIGVTLGAGLLMTPTKSVTAFVGLRKDK